MSGEAPPSGGHARFRARRLGYRLLPGDAFSYVLHLRPREWPIMAAHTALGLVLAQGLRPTLAGERTGLLAVVLLSWVVCLNGGTLALNSAFDRDTGDIGYLDAPPPPPDHLAAFGVGLMAVGGLIGAALPPAYLVAYAICVALSLAYSVPPLRLKAVAGADWVINMVGFGTLTPYAGWAATGLPITSAGKWILIGFCPLFAALYPLTQLYQLEEDRARGDRTLAIRLGMRASLAVAIVMAVGAFACFAEGARRAGGTSVTGWLALAVSLAVWLAVLVPWWMRAAELAPKGHKRGMYAALFAWATTDVAILIAVG